MGEVIKYTVDVGSDATKGIVKFGEASEKSIGNILKLSNEVGRIMKLVDASGVMKSKSSEAIATGGTRNTTVNISLGKFFENIVFNGGGVRENRDDIERQMAEVMARVLGVAETSAGY
jgi:hypothetical protein